MTGLANKAKKVTQDLQEMGDGHLDAAQGEASGQMGEKTAEYCEEGREKVHGVACAGEQFLRQRPLTSVLLARGRRRLAARPLFGYPLNGPAVRQGYRP